MTLTVTVPDALAYGSAEGMPATRVGQDVDVAAFNTVRGYGPGALRLATDIGMSVNTLLHKTNPEMPRHILSLREAIRVMRWTGDYSILKAMAAELGFVVVPAMPDQSGGDPVEAFMRYEAAHADLVRAVADAVNLGRDAVTPNEIRRVDKMAQLVGAAMNHLVAMLRGRMRAAPGATL